MEKEQDVIDALKNGDESALKHLILQNQTHVYNVCLSLLKNEEDAEDMSQEVFITFYQRIKSFRETASLKTWLYRIAINKSLEQLRKNKRLKRWGYLTSLWNNQNGNDEPREFNHPGVLMEQQEDARTLFAHIDRLATNQRLAFVLHQVEGLSYREIAKVLKVTVTSVESLLFRARANLKKSLKTYYEDSLT